MTSPERAPLGAALAMLLALTTLTGAPSPILVAAVTAFGSLLVGFGWPALLEIPSALGTRLIVCATGVAGAGLALISGTRVDPLSAVVMVIACGVLGSFIHQMLRRERHDLTHSLTGTVAGVMLTGFGSCWVLAQATAVDLGHAGIVTAIAAGLAGALLLDTTAVPARPRLLLSVLAGSAITAALAMSLAAVGVWAALALGAVTTVAAVGAHQLLASLIVSREPGASLAVESSPVVTAGVIALVAATLLG